MRGARNLEHATCSGALAHEALELRGDDAVLFADHEPRRQLAPQGPLAGRCEESLLRRWPLRRRHPRCLWRRHVWAEQLVVAVLDDVQVGRAVAARNRPQRLLAKRAAGEAPRQREAALTGI